MKSFLLFLAIVVTSAQAHGASCISKEMQMRLTAREAGLNYRLPDSPGISRELKKGITRKIRTHQGNSYVQYFNSRGNAVTDPDSIFVYRDTKGRIIGNSRSLARIKNIALPPAYDRVWISPDPDSHIQAVGYNILGDKQYRYHPAWEEARANIKFHRMREFGKALPQIREQAQDDFKSHTPKTRLLATIVKLLDKTFIRIGNEEYAENNGTFGLTTLRKKDVKVTKSGEIHFRFIGKAEVAHDITITDPGLAAAIDELKKLRGRNLFKYQDTEGKIHEIDSTEVNQYIHDISGGGGFTAKDFRTWGGTVSATQVLIQAGQPADDAAASKAVEAAVDFSCSKLGNTPTVCRENYIHPLIFQSFEDNSGTAKSFFKAVARARAKMQKASRRQSPTALSEQTVLSVVRFSRLRQRLLEALRQVKGQCTD